MSNVNALLDMNLDDLADLPEIKPYPAGAHKVTISFESKEINKKPAVIINMTAIETIELADTAESPLAAGTKTNCMYMLVNNDGKPNEISQGQLKKILASLRTGLGVQSGSTAAIMEAANGAEVVVVTKQRKNEKTDSINTQIVEVHVV